jgi:hypothetical protein
MDPLFNTIDADSPEAPTVQARERKSNYVAEKLDCVSLPTLVA